MADLVAQGPQPEHRWRQTLPADRLCLLGRTAGIWATPWDAAISRQHASICWNRGRLEVNRLPTARNPIFFRGQRQDSFAAVAGEHFVIGETTFTVTNDRISLLPRRIGRVAEQTFSSDDLRRLRFENADERIDLLSRVQEIVSSTPNDDELNGRLTTMLLTGIRRALAVAIVRVGDGEHSPVEILHWDQRLHRGGDFQPSEQLIRDAVLTGQSVSQAWTEPPPASFNANDPTAVAHAGWAFCVPLTGAACRGWAIYAEGEGDAAALDRRDDIKFARLVAATLSSMRDARFIERSRASLRQFFAPVVLDALSGQNPDEALAPREAPVSVLFCDLRGFSRRSEQSADDLLGLLHRVSDALGVTTHQILAHGGVVGDFHGDSAMGFWGWPLSAADDPVRACRTALEIARQFDEFARQPAHSLADFRVGVGIATGRAVAGKIGTADQVKVTVFGPVVNRAARLEGLTRLLRTPILLDESTASAACAALASHEGRLRRIANVRPYGFQSAVAISELLPSMFAAELTDEEFSHGEAARAAFESGDWPSTLNLLNTLRIGDPIKELLTPVIQHHGGEPPAGWDGVIEISTK
jgi:adenylate cyclase